MDATKVICSDQRTLLIGPQEHTTQHNSTAAGRTDEEGLHVDGSQEIKSVRLMLDDAGNLYKRVRE